MSGQVEERIESQVVGLLPAQLATESICVRNLREGEATTLPPALRDTGVPYIVPEWAWVVEPPPPSSPITLLTSPPPAPFALIVAGFAHGWLVLFRVLAISPLPPAVPLTWFMEALPQVFAEARSRGCVGFLTFLADNRPEEVKMARIVQRMEGAVIAPFQGSLAMGLLDGVAEYAEATEAAADEGGTD